MANVDHMSTRPERRRAFRREVQALRAVAVIGVVLYHLWPGRLTGGFAGVDVFFVISGFLICGQLVAEIERTGRISLLKFWARRIRRLLPAALLVLGVCLVLLVTLMPRLVWSENAQEIRASATYVENWLLGAHSVNYLAAENTPSLVQHYWSLSVEEQFYLAWPLLLLLAVPATSLMRLRRPRFALLCLLTAACIGSFVTALVWTSNDPASAFYATPARGWEFAAGGLVGLLIAGSARIRPSAVRAALSWVGLTILVASYAWIGDKATFPGWVTLVPVLGAATVIGAQGSSLRWSPDRVLALRPLQWLGDHSYAIYLWHWPLIIVAPWVTHGPTSWAGKLVILGLTLGLAALTKVLVEDPVRTSTWMAARRAPSYAIAIVGATALAVIASGLNGDVKRTTAAETERAKVAVHQQEHALLVTVKPSCFGAGAMVFPKDCPRPFARPASLNTAFAAADGRTDPCLQDYDAATPSFCTLGARLSPARTIAIVGNSHAWRLVPALVLYGLEHRWQFIVATRANCLGLITTPVSPVSPTAHCLRWSSLVQQHLLSLPHLDAVIFPDYRYGQKFLVGDAATATQIDLVRQRVLATWRLFTAHHVRVIITGDVPGMRPRDDPQCIAQSSVAYDPCSVSRASMVRPDLVSELAHANPTLVSYLPLTQYFCDATTCHGLIGGVIVYFDSHHLTTTYSQSLARYLGPSVADALVHGPPGKDSANSRNVS